MVLDKFTDSNTIFLCELSKAQALWIWPTIPATLIMEKLKYKYIIQEQRKTCTHLFLGVCVFVLLMETAFSIFIIPLKKKKKTNCTGCNTNWGGKKMKAREIERNYLQCL